MDNEQISVPVIKKRHKEKIRKSIVSVVECKDYSQQQVDKAIDQSLDHVGGLKQFVKAGDRVHIKPNLLTAKTPDKAATTHPSVVRRVVSIVKELGGEVTIGDSPAGISTPIEEYWKKSGLEQVALDTGARLIRFEKNKVREKQVNGRSYYIAKAVADADVVINLCKLKTHNLVLFTGAIKNMFGVIPGFRKSEYHKQAPKVNAFSEIIVDIFSVVRPQINIMDAVVAMEGNGPSAGSPKKLGLIFASTDAVALDSVAASLIGFNDGEIKTTETAYDRGLGEKRKERIQLKGVDLKAYQDLDFDLPTNRFLNYIPTSLIQFFGRYVWVRPKPNIDMCKRCGACIENCPTQAMKSEEGFPVIDYSKCINCFCCDEICPHDAIDQKASWLAQKLR